MEALVNYSSEDDQEDAGFQIRLQNSPRHHNNNNCSIRRMLNPQKQQLLAY
ncbi:uncharacterized protein LOC122623332 isoform X3 [Drosophila teissieri]|uniref:Uncharacterized protein, isoform B n=1 Tax=Drosophila yakuba TaxID=7245 RepID=A0A0R1EGK9_DROYA|nr:uncharacterized protein LOC6524834 isoform X2 [Drosophila yakuba]XP_039498503.1 uncharacterized protein LOC120456012 isoform X2 [Drosophila santomea]XP_043658358.1 uncharacterized protein LOC122623332 isoform X3 [Drosophila teissieri]KRK06340.1 uncharacterized protein Dyak_GE17192, isoform B [Drosophila yakuba]